MPLKFILGVSGSGKSTMLYDSVCRNAAENPKETYLVIVPEQFTLETQRELVLRQKKKSILNIDVLSFMRLAFRVFEELGIEELPQLDDMGKNMVLRHVLSECREPLAFFRGNMKKLGFLSELKSLLSEFEQYGIGGNGLADMIEKAQGHPMLAGKLKDMQTVRNAFLDYKQDKFMIAEEILPRLTSCIARSKMVRSSVVCLDGFTGFTPVQINLLREIFTLAREVRVAVTVDPKNLDIRASDVELFAMSKKLIYKLQETAQEAGIGCELFFAGEAEAGKNLYKPYRFSNALDLMHLERAIFRYPTEKYLSKPQHIHLFCAANREKEVHLVLEKIRFLVMEKGYRYREIAVITGDMEGYAPFFSAALKKAGIPYFMDYKKKILSNIYVEFIRSFLALFEKSWNYEAVFRHIGNGLLPFTRQEKDLLENYVLATGVRGRSRWKQEWTRSGTKELEEKLPQINELRCRFLELTEKAAERFSKRRKTVLDFVEVIYEYSTAVGCEERLWELEDRFAQEGNHSAQREYAQVYGKVMELLERMAELLGEEQVSRKEFISLFDAGIAEVKIGLIPPGMDQLIIGDLERTRVSRAKALFVLGLNDGIVPKAGGKGGIISDVEREFLSENNVELAPTQRELAYRSQYYLYLALTKPEEELYLSYSCMGSGGEALRPSYLLGKIKAVFPMLREEEKFDALSDYVNHSLGADRGQACLLQGLRSYAGWSQMPEVWQGIFEYYAADVPEKLSLFIRCAMGEDGIPKLPKKVAKLLYGEELYGSVTRFERYAACEYAHFLAYGLALKERQEFVLRSVDIGNVFHEALRIFGQKCLAHPEGWHGMYKEDTTVKYAAAQKALLEALENGKIRGARELLMDNSRSRHLLKRIERMLERTADILLYQVNRGNMEPTGFEIKFQNLSGLEELPMQEGRLHVKGTIDRLDQSEEEDINLVRVVDYKTGQKEFSLIDVYYGLQLQLILYLKAGTEAAGQGAEPAGVYYYRINDPLISGRVASEQDFQELLKLDGISSTAIGALYTQDRTLVENGELAPGKKSDVIPFAVTKKGEVSATAKAVRKNEMQSLMEYVEGKMLDIASGILDGHIERNPYQKTMSDMACAYCSYQELCSPRDPAQPGGMRALDKEHVPQDISKWKDSDKK